MKKDAVGEKGFEVFKLLDIGDHIGVRGYLFRTRTGELTVHVDEITFLAKDLLPLPEKWHGLTDVETRYRQRYVDLIMNPEVREMFVKRSQVVQALRRFFDARGYVEVETPMMHPIAGGAAARPFITHHNTLDIDLYLRIAPELYLKRLMVGGTGTGIRDQPQLPQRGHLDAAQSRVHHAGVLPAYSDYRDLMDLTEEMLPWVAPAAALTTRAQRSVGVNGRPGDQQRVHVGRVPRPRTVARRTPPGTASRAAPFAARASVSTPEAFTTCSPRSVRPAGSRSRAASRSRRTPRRWSARTRTGCRRAAASTAAVAVAVACSGMSPPGSVFRCG